MIACIITEGIYCFYWEIRWVTLGVTELLARQEHFRPFDKLLHSLASYFSARRFPQEQVHVYRLIRLNA